MAKQSTSLDKLQNAKADYLTAVYAKKTDILNKYDAVDSNNRKKRRQPRIEIADEGGDTGQLPIYDRLKAVNICRDLQRNYTAAKANLLQIRLNVAGCGPKLIINLDDEEARTGEHYFNSIWAKDCDGRDDTPYGEMIGIAAMALYREADFLVFYDDTLNDDGKVYFWEADQFANISKKEWDTNKEFPADKYSCEDGIIYEKKMGKIVAYAVASTRGKYTYKLNEVTIFRKDSASVKHIKMPWRFNQRRGTPEMLTPAGHYEDMYEILSSELQTAKVAAKYGIAITRKNNDVSESVMDNTSLDPEDILTGTPDPEEAIEAPAPTYERMESLAGGFLNYLEKDDDIKVLDFNRPSTNIKDYLEYLTVSNGASMGLFSCYSTGKVSTSYTAFRGEQILSQPTFEFIQKLLERRFCDWCAVKCLSWALSHGKIDSLPEGWQEAITFQWPTMREVNEYQAASANEIKLKSGQTDFQELLGPHWKKRLTAYATQLEVARALNIPLSVFETKSGSPVDQNNSDNGGSDDETQPAKKQSFINKILQVFK